MRNGGEHTAVVAIQTRNRRACGPAGCAPGHEQIEVAVTIVIRPSNSSRVYSSETAGHERERGAIVAVNARRGNSAPIQTGDGEIKITIAIKIAPTRCGP